MKLWRKDYTMRRYGQQSFCNGYASRGFTDSVVKLNVQTIGSTQTTVTPEGKRSTRRIKSYGSFPFRVEDVPNGIQADRLFFNGEWYACESSVLWEHTPLSHYRSEFVKVSEALASVEHRLPSIETEGGESYDG